MKAQGYTELTTTELPNELRFTVVRHDGWFDWFRRGLAPVGAIFILCVPDDPHFSSGFRFLLFFYMILLSSMNLSWVHGGTTILRVTSSELLATGNLRNLFSTRATMPASEVTWLGFYYHRPDLDGLSIEGEETDIYVPGLNQEEAEAVAVTILRRFPNIRPDLPR